MKKAREIRLRRSVRRQKDETAKKSKADMTSWEGVDRELFEELRTLRLRWAEERAVPPYIIFSDNTLRELARVRPSNLERMRLLYGIGEQKLRDFGQPVLERILAYCAEHQLPLDQATASLPRYEEPRKETTRLNPQRSLAFEEFRRGTAIAKIVTQTGRSESTIIGYLAEFIREEKPATIVHWVPDAVYQRVAAAARQVGTDRLKPIFLALGEQVPYDQIRLVVTHLTADATK
jgi:ATP-dependent DNA helicase RecQ